jgi:hypothetical protein
LKPKLILQELMESSSLINSKKKAKRHDRIIALESRLGGKNPLLSPFACLR